jgi:HK97 family phage portal protein
MQKDESVVAVIDPDNLNARMLLTSRMEIEGYENIAQETYLKNSVMFACIDKIASSVATVPLEIVQQNGPDSWEAIDHPLTSLISYAPNPGQSSNEFFYSLVATLLIGGRVYIEKVSPITGPNIGIPQELYIHRPDRIEPVRDKMTGQLVKYVYHGINEAKKDFPVDPLTRQSNLREIKLFNPLNKNWGAPVSTSLFREIDTLNAATLWNKALIENSAKAGMTIIVHGDVLAQTQVDNLQKFLNSISGPAQSGKNKVIPISSRSGEKATVDIIKDTWNPAELDFNETTWNLAKRVCMGMGVPPQILGIPGESKFANYSEARSVMWDDTVLRYTSMVVNSLNRWFFGMDRSVKIRYNIDNIPAYEHKRVEYWERINNAQCLTLNEKRQRLGLELLGPEADVMLVPAGMLPLSVVAGSEDFESTAEQELESLGLSEREKKEYLEELAEYRR